MAADFSWWFIVGWMTVNFCAFGGGVDLRAALPLCANGKRCQEICLPDRCYVPGKPGFLDASAPYFRVLNPNVDTEQAYILGLSIGIAGRDDGLMVAAMASATASMATTRLNVFAGAFTPEVYHRVMTRRPLNNKLVLSAGW